MLRRNLALFSVFLAFAGCSAEPNREDWPEQYADSFCDWERRCLSAVYFDTWDDHESCLDETSDDVDDVFDDLPGCDFDARRAEDCLNRLNDNCQDSGGIDEILDICLGTLDC